MSEHNEDTCIIHMVRHGQTILNREVRFRGRRDVPLNDVGRSEAIAAGHMLRPEGIGAVYSSPLGRALEVGTAIATASNLDKVEPWEDLVNVDYGRWEGLTIEESDEVDPAAWEAYKNDPENAQCPGGEKLIAAADRVVRALRAIGAAHPGQSVAAVSHGVMLRLAVLMVAGPVTEDWQFKISTGGSIVFAVTNGEIRLVTDASTLSGSRMDTIKVPTSV